MSRILTKRMLKRNPRKSQGVLVRQRPKLRPKLPTKAKTNDFNFVLGRMGVQTNRVCQPILILSSIWNKCGIL